MNYSTLLDMALQDTVMFSIYVGVVLSYFNWAICLVRHLGLCTHCEISQVRGHLRQHLIFIAILLSIEAILFYNRVTFPFVDVDGIQTLAIYYGAEPIAWFLMAALNVYVPQHLSSEIESEIYIRRRCNQCKSSKG